MVVEPLRCRLWALVLDLLKLRKDFRRSDSSTRPRSSAQAGCNTRRDLQPVNKADSLQVEPEGAAGGEALALIVRKPRIA